VKYIVEIPPRRRGNFFMSPKLINEQEIKDYFLYNRNVKHWSRAAFSVSISAIKFFFEKTLQRKWQVFGLVRPPRDKSLPVILSLKEVNKIFSCIKMEHHKACLKTTCFFKFRSRLRETYVQKVRIDKNYEKNMCLKMLKVLTIKDYFFFSGKNEPFQSIFLLD